MGTKRQDKTKSGLLNGKTFRLLINEMTVRFGTQSTRDYLVLSYFQLRTQDDVLMRMGVFHNLHTEADLERYKQEFVATGASKEDWYTLLFKPDKETGELQFQNLTESEIVYYSRIKTKTQSDKLHITGGILSSEELKFYIPILVERFGLEPTLNFLRLSYFRLLNYNRYISHVDDGKFRRTYHLSSIKEYKTEFEKLRPDVDFLERMRGYAIYEH